MKCPICSHQDTKVVDSRVSADELSIRRRRECLRCEFRFSTYESVEILDLTIVKKDGRKEAYNREKIVKGLRRSLEKRPISDEDFKQLINVIERDLQALRKTEIASDLIGEIIMDHLKKVDKVAYIRFASVYESFEDAETFLEELEKLIDKKTTNKKKN
ncbi:transcriptional regulator NrdR [Candidatus Parcubacteria bacterium]|nr:transcriptional regulator NrdR [Patescibacteria group bacterium]MBU4309410.1 transcriptional regulator NrdR [Patescibacteria group bacterium]MBU4431967.1 transcriptional regulator NrdR [Patescibacteria group bacterium]MBU4577771.1 transcriptional regulator NrdR [Patescibacteria group bacterium]MCG2697456.1 transcriptional regulator NrdR [Candidatus Parcubacteria bacterium]